MLMVVATTDTSWNLSSLAQNDLYLIHLAGLALLQVVTQEPRLLPSCNPTIPEPAAVPAWREELEREEGHGLPALGGKGCVTSTCISLARTPSQGPSCTAKETGKCNLSCSWE